MQPPAFIYLDRYRNEGTPRTYSDQACLDRYPGLSVEDFRAPCRETFARLLPEHRQYFPETVWYFSERRDRFNKPLYQDTGVAPEWRP